MYIYIYISMYICMCIYILCHIPLPITVPIVVAHHTSHPSRSQVAGCCVNVQRPRRKRPPTNTICSGDEQPCRNLSYFDVKKMGNLTHPPSTLGMIWDDLMPLARIWICPIDPNSGTSNGENGGFFRPWILRYHICKPKICQKKRTPLSSVQNPMASLYIDWLERDSLFMECDVPKYMMIRFILSELIINQPSSISYSLISQYLDSSNPY